MAPTVVAWTDYICPWAYAARPHTDWLRSEGVEVELRGYELHPGIGPEGRPVRPGGRLDRVLDHLAEICADQGLEFVKPTRSPNSRRCLELLEVTARHVPAAVIELDRRLSSAHWVRGLALDDLDVLEGELRAAVGADRTAELAPLVADGEGSRALDRSRAMAHDLGVTATPAWRLDELTITGLHPAEQFRRWARRVLGLPDGSNVVADPAGGSS